MKSNNTKLQESITLQRRVIAGYEQTISENKTRRAYFIALNDYKQAAKIEQTINRDEQDLNELKQQLNNMEKELNTTNNTPATMNANNIHVNNIVATLTNRNNIRKEIELPVIAAIREQAAKFNGKVFNRRFTAAVTKSLQDNPNRINVNFRTKWNGEAEYDIINVHYNHNGNYGEFSIYPDRTNVHDYTDNDGRLVAEQLVATCDRYETATLDNIAADEIAIERTPEFVARVEALQAEVEAINKDFPLSLRARFTGNIDFRR